MRTTWTCLALLPLLGGLAGCAATGQALGSAGGVAGLSENQQQAIASIGEDLDAILSEMSLADERDLGETVSLQAYATPGFGRPIRDARVMRFVNTIAAVVGRYSDRPLIPYFVVVIDTPHINAFAAPGGYIFLTRGAVEAMRSEAELACVIAHEIAHITERHALHTIRRTRGFAALGKGFAAATDQDFHEFDEMVRELCSSLLNNGFDRGSEIDADLKGVDFALAAGYDPRALLDFIDTLAQQGDHVSGGMSTHPEPQDRREEIEDHLAELPEGSQDGLVKQTNRFATFQSWLAHPEERW